MILLIFTKGLYTQDEHNKLDEMVRKILNRPDKHKVIIFPSEIIEKIEVINGTKESIEIRVINPNEMRAKK